MTTGWACVELHGMKIFPHPSLFRSVVATEYPKEDASSSPQKMCCGISRYTLSFLSSTTAPVWLARGAPATKVSSPRLIIPMAESTENPERKKFRTDRDGRVGRRRKRVMGLVLTVGLRGSSPLSVAHSAHLPTNEMCALSDYWLYVKLMIGVNVRCAAFSEALEANDGCKSNGQSKKAVCDLKRWRYTGYLPGVSWDSRCCCSASVASSDVSM